MLDKLYSYRFELFLTTQLSVLFGSLVVPITLFENWVMPILLILNLVFGVLLVSKKKLLSRFLFGVMILIIFELFINSPSKNIDNFKLVSYFLFFSVVTLEIVQQVWKAKLVGKNVILGLISGYISLGLIGFFLFLSIETIYPNSFSGLDISREGAKDLTEQLMYFSYVTLLTIGYGDILPITPIAQKATLFIGLIGQFYLVVLTAIVVGKHINQDSSKE